MKTPDEQLPDLAVQPGLMQRVIEIFLCGNLSAMLIILSLLAGFVALMVTPREEEPQIVVPLADVFVSVPGASAREVERQVATRLEKLLYQIDGVEYVYSMSKSDQCVVTVRFYVGEDREDSLIKLHNKLATNEDAVPGSVTGWVIKPLEIDDVPIVGITLYTTDDRYSDVDLRRIAEELEIRLQAVKDTGRTYLYGGRAMKVSVAIDPEKLSARHLSIHDLERSLQAANVTLPAGSLHQLDQEILVDAGTVLTEPGQVADLVVGVYEGRPVYLRDVASIAREPEEVSSYTGFGYGPASETQADHSTLRYPAVTLGIAKKKGANAVWVSRDVQAELEHLATMLIPAGVEYRITRDYGKTANDKVNELVEGLVVAIIIVIGLLSLVMGWREGLIVATAVPITFALTLLINYLAGYTINRVTLFALILALGLVVDDPIVDVENIYRHLKMRLQKPLDAVITAVNEVRPPIILATLAVIVSFVPMFFITGMMGPYMRPMALNVPLAMLMSLVVAFTITPWMSYHILKGSQKSHDGGESGTGDGYDLHGTLVYRVYAACARPLLESDRKAWLLLMVTFLLFLASCLLVVTRAVPLKMLPFDNKNEFQLIVDMAEGSTLERTAAAVDALADYLMTVNEVTDVTTYIGTPGPMDFNGLVRHYYLRSGSNVGEIRVNLIEKDFRSHQSNELGLRLRHDLKTIADRYHANIKLVQIPPGPPVIATLAVEVYGRPFHTYDDLLDIAGIVEDRFIEEPGVVDVDSVIEAPQRKLVFVTDKEKASLAGLTTQQIAEALKMAIDGADVAVLHDADEVNPLAIRLRLPRAARSDVSNTTAL